MIREWMRLKAVFGRDLNTGKAGERPARFALQTGSRCRHRNTPRCRKTSLADYRKLETESHLDFQSETITLSQDAANTFI
jgi:hypothetical protein